MKDVPLALVTAGKRSVLAVGQSEPAQFGGVIGPRGRPNLEGMLAIFDAHEVAPGCFNLHRTEGAVELRLDRIRARHLSGYHVDLKQVVLVAVLRCSGAIQSRHHRRKRRG